jgi:hypothetical protein
MMPMHTMTALSLARERQQRMLRDAQRRREIRHLRAGNRP